MPQTLSARRVYKHTEGPARAGRSLDGRGVRSLDARQLMSGHGQTLDAVR